VSGPGAADLIGGRWERLPETGAGAIQSRNPARPDQVVWSGVPEPSNVDAAVASARKAFDEWSVWPMERRLGVLRAFRTLCEKEVARIAGLICDETGKAMWDATAEAAALTAKVDITLDPDGPLKRVTGFELGLGGTKSGRCWFRPHGVMAVVGPFNFPAHLPNGHIVPALAMGNTVVFKPSDKAPAVGQLLAELLQRALDEAGAPAGVVNLVQGGAEVAKKLVGHDGLDGVLFTGSWPVGRAIMQANLDRPGRILALEMGGNNAAVVMPDADLKQAAIECVRSAFVSTGQRCTCTRRLIVHDAVAKPFIAAVCKAASNLVVGDPRATHPVFMGPIISESAWAGVLEFQSQAAASGGAEILVRSTAMDGPGWFVTPGVMRVERFEIDGDGAGCDTEVFGPLLRVSVVRDLAGAIEQANATRFGLAASVFTRDEAAAAEFAGRVRAGCINVNTSTAGWGSRETIGRRGLSRWITARTRSRGWWRRAGRRRWCPECGLMRRGCGRLRGVNRAIDRSVPATRAVVAVRVFGVLLMGLCFPAIPAAGHWLFYWATERSALVGDPGPAGRLLYFVYDRSVWASVWAWFISEAGAHVIGFGVGCVLVWRARWRLRRGLLKAAGGAS
jgi:succinylglutamic semialdehyde dehydrogenase